MQTEMNFVLENVKYDNESIEYLEFKMLNFLS